MFNIDQFIISCESMKINEYDYEVGMELFGIKKKFQKIYDNAKELDGIYKLCVEGIELVLKGKVKEGIDKVSDALHQAEAFQENNKSRLMKTAIKHTIAEIKVILQNMEVIQSGTAQEKKKALSNLKMHKVHIQDYLSGQIGFQQMQQQQMMDFQNQMIMQQQMTNQMMFDQQAQAAANFNMGFM